MNVHLFGKKLHFHKIASNSKELVNALPEEVRVKEFKSLDPNHSSYPLRDPYGYTGPSNKIPLLSE